MSDEVTLELFFEQFANVNPFLDNRVNGPAPAASDAADVHRPAFERLTALASQAVATRRGFGAVLWGEAGIGKSHLLARLDRWATETGAPFLYLHNLQASPQALPRSLLHTIISVLTNGRRRGFVGTPLYDLVRVSAVEAVGQVIVPDWSFLENAYHRWLDRLGPTLGDRLVYEVLLAFFRSSYVAREGKDDGVVASLAVRWLSGGALDPEEARTLSLPPARQHQEPVALEDAQQIKQVLVALSRLALCQKVPFVIAIDQVDNLDREQFAALARFLEALLDTAPDLLVITTGIQATLVGWKQEGVIQTSAWDRIVQTEVSLQRLKPALAERIVRTRLDAFFTPFASLDKIAHLRQEDPLFPLGQAWAESALRKYVDVRPRDAISRARDGWQRQQARLRQVGAEEWLVSWPGGEASDQEQTSTAGGDAAPRRWTPEQRLAAIDQQVEQELRTIAKRIVEEPGSLPSDADQLAGVIHDILVHFCEQSYDLLMVQRIDPPRRGTPPTYHLSLRRRKPGGEATTGILVMAEKAALSVTGFLRRLVQNSQPLDRLVIVTDARIESDSKHPGLPLGERGEEYLEALGQRGQDRFLVVPLSFPEQIDLAALSSILGRARAGDIEIEPPGEEPQEVTWAEVVNSRAWRKRTLEHRLLRELVAVQPSTPPAPVSGESAPPSPGETEEKTAPTLVG